MIPWWIAVIALFAGVLFGFVLLALVMDESDNRKGY